MTFCQHICLIKSLSKHPSSIYCIPGTMLDWHWKYWPKQKAWSLSSRALSCQGNQTRKQRSITLCVVAPKGRKYFTDCGSTELKLEPCNELLDCPVGTGALVSAQNKHCKSPKFSGKTPDFYLLILISYKDTCHANAFQNVRVYLSVSSCGIISISYLPWALLNRMWSVFHRYITNGDRRQGSYSDSCRDKVCLSQRHIKALVFSLYKNAWSPFQLHLAIHTSNIVIRTLCLLGTCLYNSVYLTLSKLCT